MVEYDLIIDRKKTISKGGFGCFCPVDSRFKVGVVGFGPGYF